MFGDVLRRLSSPASLPLARGGGGGVSRRQERIGFAILARWRFRQR